MVSLVKRCFVSHWSSFSFLDRSWQCWVTWMCLSYVLPSHLWMLPYLLQRLVMALHIQSHLFCPLFHLGISQINCHFSNLSFLFQIYPFSKKLASQINCQFGNDKLPILIELQIMRTEYYLIIPNQICSAVFWEEREGWEQPKRG